MARLPIPGQDEGTWGNILNDYLQIAHNADGTVKDDAVTKTDVGLGDVDNTSDANKPISTATQTALDGKLTQAQADALYSLLGHTHAYSSLTGLPAIPAGLVYPIEEGYGYHSASCLPENVEGAGWFGGWQVRIWIPPNKTITKVGMVITVAAVGVATLAGFAVYSDDGQTKLGEATDPNIFLSTGYRSANLSSSIAAQAAGRFVRVTVSHNYSTSPPDCSFCIEGGPGVGTAFNSGLGANRSAYHNAVSSFPASFNPSTGAGLAGWGSTNYLPLILLG